MQVHGASDLLLFSQFIEMAAAVRLSTKDDNGVVQSIASVMCNPKIHASTSGEIHLICGSFTRDPSILALGHDEDDGSSFSAGAGGRNGEHKRVNIFSDEAVERDRLMKFGYA